MAHGLWWREHKGGEDTGVGRRETSLDLEFGLDGVNDDDYGIDGLEKAEVCLVKRARFLESHVLYREWLLVRWRSR